ncbi:MAG: ornithine carbamoyltransferase [Elainellaceae cyanobacterium]
MSVASLKGRDLLSLADLSQAELEAVIDLASSMKSGSVEFYARKTLGLLFSKASTRTRVSFSVAMYQLGGQVIDLNVNVTQIQRGEPVKDTARVLDRYLDVLAIRTYAQSELEDFARYADIPVINALTDLEHPCQVLADLQTVKENFDGFEGLTLAYFGDGNNMVHSLLLGCALVGMNIKVATPPDFQPDPAVVQQAKEIAGDRASILITDDPNAAATQAHVLYTDVWASMGQEDSATSRVPVFQPFQINDELVKQADPEAIVLHCLPAHRDEEITDSVMEGKHSRIWDQAENRLHAQKALLASVLGAE